MKKLLLIFLLLPFFSCTKKNEEQYVLQNNEDEPMESSVIQSEELPKSTSSSDPFIEYTIPGVNISFKYPNNERIKNLEIRKNIKEFNSENDVRINCKVYADEFFEHGVTKHAKWEKFCFNLGIFLFLRVFFCFFVQFI